VRRRRFWTGFCLLVLAGLVGALFLPTPYYLLEPGSVRPAEQRIDVEGTRSYDTPGQVLFTTVMIDQATLGGLVRGALDEAIVVKDEEEVYGGQDRRSSQRLNQQRMDLSKLVATKVALDYVGHPASFTAEGARVVELLPGSAAADALRPGDVITGVDGDRVNLPEDIGRALSDRSPGDTVTVRADRPVPKASGTGTQASGERAETRTVDVEITLGARDGQPDQPVVGVVVDPVNPSIESPVTVEIDSGKVTGPSAGLAWALAVVDRLTPGSLTGGRDVAVTGELLPDGSVGAIGGIVQKVAAVERSGVEMFLYPASTPEAEQREMRRLAGDDLELRPVASLAEAVEVLAPAGAGRRGGG
jgi:PDZ domain-containing protein